MRDFSKLYDNEMALVRVCADMEYNGILIDKKYVTASLLYEQREIEQTRKDFETVTGRAFKDSSKLFAEIFNERGLGYRRTDKGNPSFDAEFLEYSKEPIAKLIYKIRQHEKRVSTYFTNFLYYCDDNNYIHPSMNQAGTITGRFSYSNPNLQNLPKEDEENLLTNIRRAFIAPKGFNILSIDYDQVEYRVMIDYANEFNLINKVKMGADIHQATADLLGISRKGAKTINFAILYGAGAEHLGLMLGIPTSQAKQVRDMYLRKLPGVKRFIYEVRRIAEQRGITHNVFNRRYYCSDIRWSYKHANYIIQGTSADVIKFAMVKVHEMLQGFKTKMVVSIHDELLFYLHKDEEHLVLKIQEIMENIYPSFNGLKLTTKASVSDKSFSYWDLKSYG